MADFMFQNMAYRATVYRTGVLTYAVTIGILLIKIGNRRTVITRISPFVITIGLSVFLVRIGHQWTIVRSVRNAIIVRVVVASIANTVPISVLLSGIWCFGSLDFFKYVYFQEKCHKDNCLKTPNSGQ